MSHFPFRRQGGSRKVLTGTTVLRSVSSVANESCSEDTWSLHPASSDAISTKDVRNNQKFFAFIANSFLKHDRIWLFCIDRPRV
jgi:hypothetical protein